MYGGEFVPLDFLDFNRHDMDDDTGVVRVEICDVPCGGDCPADMACAVAHPGFDVGAYANRDYAVIILPPEKADLISDVVPVRMNRDGGIPAEAGDPMESFGWGDTDPNPNAVDNPDEPYTVTLPYVPNGPCQEDYGGVATITQYMLCGYDDGG